MSMSKQKSFFQHAYNLGEDRVPAGYGWPMEVDPQQEKFLVKIRKDVTTGRALDIGCGQGRHTFLFAQNGFEAYGIDFLERPILEARQKALADNIKNAHFEVADVLHVEFPENYFDIILDWSVLDHIYPKDWKKYLHNINSVLKPGGFLILTEFSARDTRITNPDINSKDEANYDHFFREDEIKELFKDTFSIVEVVHNELNTTSHFAMINVLLQKTR